MTNKHVNAIIVGAGAGGGIIAKELATGGISVVLFERGEWPNYDEHPNDELISQRTEVLGVIGRHDIPQDISYERLNLNPSISWYIRADKRHIREDKLMKFSMLDHDISIIVSDDSRTKLCQQCHSPNFKHQTGSQDDRTPSGVHERISCMACHPPHSNDARSSYKNCHPAISKCKIDVTIMNTTFADINSPNNIHSVSCSNCHTNAKELRL